MKWQRAKTLAMLTIFGLASFAMSTAARAEGNSVVQLPQPVNANAAQIIVKSCRIEGSGEFSVGSEFPEKQARMAADRGNANATAHNYRGAINEFTRAIDLNSTFARPNAPIEDYFFSNCNISKLLADYDQVIENEPNNPYALALRGELKFMKYDDVGAKADFDRAIANKPDLFFALVRRADLFNRRDTGSLADCNEALKYYPNCARLHHDKGIAYSVRHEPERAIEEFNKASAIQPQWSRPYFMLAQEHGNMGNSSKALVCFEECLRYEKTWFEPYLKQAEIWLYIHNYQRAISNYNQAIALSGTENIWLYQHRAKAKLASGDVLGAIADFTFYAVHQPSLLVRFSAHLLTLCLIVQLAAMDLGRSILKRKLLMFE